MLLKTWIKEFGCKKGDWLALVHEKEHCIIVSIERASRSDVRGDHFVKFSSLILLRTWIKQFGSKKVLNDNRSFLFGNQCHFLYWRTISFLGEVFQHFVVSVYVPCLTVKISLRQKRILKKILTLFVSSFEHMK